MPTHKAEADWHGAFDDGEGKMRLGSGAFEGAYSYRSRMEDSAPGTNPEELLGAAHAGCFSMSLARRLSADGRPPPGTHPHRSPGALRARGGGVRHQTRRPAHGGRGTGRRRGLFLEKADAAKRDCAVSKALAGVGEITLEAKLVGHAG